MDTRNAVSVSYVRTRFPRAYQLLSQVDDLEIVCEESDLSLYVYEGELYAESHDAQTLFVFRDEQLIEIDFFHRPR